MAALGSRTLFPVRSVYLSMISRIEGPAIRNRSMSPASASFDLYKDFDARGKHFKALVNAL